MGLINELPQTVFTAKVDQLLNWERADDRSQRYLPRRPMAEEICFLRHRGIRPNHVCDSPVPRP
jgi:hypothetical protein